MLQVAPSAYRRHAARQRRPELRRARSQRDEGLIAEIGRVWQADMQVYGVRRVWHQLQRKGIAVARCTVELLMRRLGLQGLRGDKRVRTTITDNVLAETINWLYKAELIHRRPSWKTRSAVELVTLEWVAWYNHQRLLGAIGYIPPAQAEEFYHRTHSEAVSINVVL